MSKSQRGFTLPELLVVGGFIVLSLMAMLLVISPTDFSVRQRNTKRQLDVAKLVQNINKYKADNGRLPAGISSNELIISSDEGDVNLCADLVPTYLKDLPIDPSLDGDIPFKSCAEQDATYLLGYTVYQRADGHVVVKAPLAENKNIQATN